MMDVLTSQTMLLTLVVGTYLGAQWLYSKVRFMLLHPLLVSLCVISLYIWALNIPYNVFMDKVQIIDYMLGMSVVALGYLLHENMVLIRKNAMPILVAVFLGSIAGVVSVVWIAKLMGATPQIIASLQPKSVTTPIALVVSTNSGGIAPLTSIVVVLVGIFGGVAAPVVLRILRIDNPVASGLAMGSAAHAMGTAKAIEMGAVQGAISGLAIALMGLTTAILIPVIESFI